MDTSTFLGFTQIADTHFQFTVEPHHLGGRRGGLFGGCGLAGGVLALESTTGRMPVWATAQYASTAASGDRLDLNVVVSNEGRTITQARVQVDCGDRDVLTVLGALGERTEYARGQWDTMPACPPPEDSERVVREDNGSVHSRTDARMARGMFGFTGTGTPSGDQNNLVWVRLRDVELGSASLSLLADYMASSIGNSVAKLVMCTSLDNTIRFAEQATQQDIDNEWVLCDNRVSFVGNGFAYGQCHMWSRSGRLLATASQSMTVVLQDKP